MATKKAIDLNATMTTLMRNSKEAADSRFSGDDKFSRAAAIVATTPSGVGPKSVAVEARNAVSDMHHSIDTIWIPISLVRDNPRNARHFYDPVKISARAASIAKEGQMTPALACVDWENPGGYILIGGHYRKKALQQLGRTEIQVKLLPAKNNLDLYRLSYAENAEREDGTPLDNAFVWRGLMSNGELPTHEAIADALGIPRSTVTKTLKLLSLPPSVLDVLTETPDRFTLTAAYELTLFENLDTKALENLAKQIATGKLSTRDLTKLRNELPKPLSHRKIKEISRQYKILEDNQVVGHIKDWDSGKVVLEVIISESSKRQQLVEELRRRFGLDAL